MVVGPRKALARDLIQLKEVNWLGGAHETDIRVRIRSTSPPAPASLRFTDAGAEVLLALAEEGVSPGQACVFYGAHDERVLGGGWISSARLSD